VYDTHIARVEWMFYDHGSIARGYTSCPVPDLPLILSDEYISLEHIMIHCSLNPCYEMPWSQRQQLTDVSSKKKSLAGRLSKYVTSICGSCAIAKPRKKIKAHRKVAVLCAGAILTRQRGDA